MNDLKLLSVYSLYLLIFTKLAQTLMQLCTLLRRVFVVVASHGTIIGGLSPRRIRRGSDRICLSPPPPRRTLWRTGWRIRSNPIGSDRIRSDPPRTKSADYSPHLTVTSLSWKVSSRYVANFFGGFHDLWSHLLANLYETSNICS